MSKLLNEYFQRNVDNFKAQADNNSKRMQELMEQSQKMQQEYNNLDASNKYINSLLEEIAQLPKEEVNNGSTENVSGS